MERKKIRQFFIPKNKLKTKFCLINPELRVARVLPMFAISAFLLSSSFGIIPSFANPEESSKFKLDDRVPVKLDGNSSENLLLGYKGKTKNIAENGYVILIANGVLVDTNGKVIENFGFSQFPQVLEKNTKLKGIITVNSESVLSHFITSFGAHHMEIEFVLIGIDNGIVTQSSDSIIINP